MDGPAPQPPIHGQPQQQRRSPHNNQRQQHNQWPRRSQHNNNNKNHPRIPPQQKKNFKRRNNGKRGGQTELGFFGSVPSLQDLQRENRKRARRYYKNNTGALPRARALPVSSKPPPYFPPYLSNDNNNSKIPWLSPTGRFVAPAAPTPAPFPGANAANPAATPIIAANQDAAADKLEVEGLHAGLDFFATNDGLVLYNDTPAPSDWIDDGEMDSHSLSGSEEEEDDNEEDEEHRMHKRLLRRPAGSTFAGDGFNGGIATNVGGASSIHGRIIHRLRERVAQQDAYIAELEDDNLRYRERLDLLVHQLHELQEGSGGGPLVANENRNEVADADVAMKKGNDNDEGNDGVIDGSEMNESPAVKA